MDDSGLLADLSPARGEVGSARPRSLAEWAVAAGVVSAEQVNEALEEGRQTGECLGEVFVRRGWMEEVQVAEVLAEVWHLPFVSGVSPPQDPALWEAMPVGEASRLEACPLSRDGEGGLVVALADPSDDRLRALQALLGENIRPVVVPQSELLQALLKSPKPESAAVVEEPLSPPVSAAQNGHEDPDMVSDHHQPLVPADDVEATLSPPVSAAQHGREVPDIVSDDPHPLMDEIAELTATLDSSGAQLNRIRAGLDGFAEALAQTREELHRCERRLELLEAERTQDDATIREVLDLMTRLSRRSEGPAAAVD